MALSATCACCASIRLLDDAAIEAVRQWRFSPTLLNGEAVPIIMTATVAFNLN